MDDLVPFESPKVLIDGALENILKFEVACNAFIQNCTFEKIRYIEPKTGDKVVKFRFHHRMPPTLRRSAYYVLNDLRHALDQAVCDAAVELGRPNSKKIYFPFGKTPKNLADEILQKCKNVNRELVAFIAGFKPHYGGDDLLYALGNLAGPNKHQRIVRISFNQTGLQVLGGDAFISHADSRPLKLNKWNELHNELEFMRTGPGAQGKIDATPVLKIVLGDGEAVLGDPAPTVLRAMASKIEGIVLGIEAETARIKGG